MTGPQGARTERKPGVSATMVENSIWRPAGC